MGIDLGAASSVQSIVTAREAVNLFKIKPAISSGRVDPKIEYF
jgi:hypothetical protein